MTGVHHGARRDGVPLPGATPMAMRNGDSVSLYYSYTQVHSRRARSRQTALSKRDMRTSCAAARPTIQYELPHRVAVLCVYSAAHLRWLISVAHLSPSLQVQLCITLTRGCVLSRLVMCVSCILWGRDGTLRRRQACQALRRQACQAPCHPAVHLCVNATPSSQQRRRASKHAVWCGNRPPVPSLGRIRGIGSVEGRILGAVTRAASEGAV